MNSIAIIRLSALGDIVHTIPAFNWLRNQFPKARITWFAEPAGAKLLQYVSGIDEIVVTNLKKKGLINKLKTIKQIKTKYKKLFDVIIDFQGLIKSALFAKLLSPSKGGIILGFAKGNLKESQAGFFYSRMAPSFDENRHVIHKNMHLARCLMVEASNRELETNEAIHYPLKEIGENDGLKFFLKEHHLEEKRYIVLNVGGGWPSKVLSTAQYIEIIEKLNITNDAKSFDPVVVLWGNDAEREVARRVSQATGAVMADFFDFEQLILLIRGARLVITCDTLALHLSDMVETLSIGIFGPTSPWRNGSLLKNSKAVFEKLPCGFCYKKKCGTIDCIKKLKLDQVISSIEQLYEEFY